MKTILVTGGNGVLGSAFKQIESDWPEYEFVYWGSIDCNLRIESEAIVFIEYLDPDYIIHTAALSGGSPRHSDIDVTGKPAWPQGLIR